METCVDLKLWQVYESIRNKSYIIRAKLPDMDVWFIYIKVYCNFLYIYGDDDAVILYVEHMMANWRITYVSLNIKMSRVNI